MSEQIWCDMHIEVPVHWWPAPYDNEADVPKWLDKAMDALCWQWDTIEHELLNDLGTVRVTLQGCQNYGTSGLGDLRGWLAQRGIPYSIDQEGKYEWDGETIVFDGTFTERGTVATNDGAACITLSMLNRLGVTTLDELRAWFQRYDWKPTVEHLRDRPAPTFGEEQ
jgi:hypothetical protein